MDLRSAPRSLERQAEQVHTVATQHSFGNPEGVVKDGTGTSLGTNTVRTNPVASVAHGLWVAATRDLTPETIRPMAKRIVEGSTR